MKIQVSSNPDPWDINGQCPEVKVNMLIRVLLQTSSFELQMQDLYYLYVASLEHGDNQIMILEPCTGVKILYRPIQVHVYDFKNLVNCKYQSLLFHLRHSKDMGFKFCLFKS